MSIDNLQLPGFLYESMFKKNLIDLKSLNDSPKNFKIDFLGGNEKNIVFLVNNSQSKFLADKELTFLSGLLTACRLTMADIALINFFQNRTFNYHELTNRLNPKKILIFDVPAANLDLPFTIPFFQVQNFHEQVYMLSPSLTELQINKDLRKKLWESLQKIFKI
ncbi:MAG: hypothetical protein ACRDE8_07735 [Ginsengibacter sp.]